mmetsp:Transcript_5622/g.16329  ORF Transcript_5622/g.16329 Transcript_5622/m.16329 type:complete len:84 (-) Transcript_5622:81-332(-)
MSAPPLTLYKQLMREAKRFQNYNFREYAIRFAASFKAGSSVSWATLLTRDVFDLWLRHVPRIRGRGCARSCCRLCWKSRLVRH